MALFYESNEKTQSPAFENLSDVDLDQNTLTNGQVPVYNATTRKWENAVVDVANKFNSDNVAPVEETATASQTYDTGDYLIFDNKYCKVIQPIAQGDVIEFNVNIQNTSVSSEIKLLEEPLFKYIHSNSNTTYQNLIYNLANNASLKPLFKRIKRLKIIILTETFNLNADRMLDNRGGYFTRFEVQSTTYGVEVYGMKFDSATSNWCKYYKYSITTEGTQFTDFSNNYVTNGAIFEFYGEQ